jgi:membrane protease YdiL (CAAX protease family)
MQIVFGFGVSPWLIQQLQDHPQFSFGIGPILSQLGLAVTAGALIQRILTKNKISSEFFKYDARPADLAVGGIMVGVGLLGAIFLSKLSGGAGVSTPEQMPRSVEEMKSIVAMQQPAALLCAGAASIFVAPWIEERIYRGAILQGLLPYLSPVASVRFLLSSQSIHLCWLQDSIHT